MHFGFRFHFPCWPVGFIACCLVLLVQRPLTAEEPVDYNRDVRPILSNNCFFCHGFDEENREADLRLDTHEGATESDAVVPGEPDESGLIDRIFSDDSDLLMPPSDSAYKLTDQQKETLRRWVKQGAPYQQHWAYRKLERPTVERSEYSHPVDAFLGATWKSKQQTPVGRATPRELIRRLSYDLRGLPPTTAQVEAFTRQSSNKEDQAKAFSELVQQWTQSTEYAEHQGLIWLDLVRWADSSGMVSDEPIATGSYRAYVIQAFRDNMPFDQFTREQLAGDLLPDAQRSERTLIASGYNRLVKTNSEAGVIEAEALHVLKGEHVRAVGTVWLGATTGCAECHDHKYDPITAKDYYSLAAFFDDLTEIGVYDPGDRRYPLHFIYDDQQQRAQDDLLSEEIASLRTQIYDCQVDNAALKKWETETKAAIKDAPEKDEFVWLPAELPPARLSSGQYQQTDQGRETLAAKGELHYHSASELMTGFMHKIGDGKTPQFFNVMVDQSDVPEAIAVEVINGAYQRAGWHKNYFTTYYWGPADSPTIKETLSSNLRSKDRLVHMGPIPEVDEANKFVRLDLPKNKMMKSEYLPVGLGWAHIGGKVTWGDCGFDAPGKIAISARLAESTIRYWWEQPLNRDDRDLRMKLVVNSLKLSKKERRPIHLDAIGYAYRETISPDKVAELKDAYKELYLLRQRATETALVSKARPIQPEKTSRLRDRGNFMDDKAPVVSPAVPEFFGQLELDNGRAANRMDLAQWLTSPKNPLTARVFVNRLWYQFFGRGLSETLEDAGNQGDRPSHPELLDWLAMEFIESGWDVKHMIQLLVSSQAYQLSSTPTAELAISDPTNRLHLRQGRQRHSAEEIRDSALATAGMLRLTEEIPTQSFYPYQPESYWVKSNKIMYGSRYQVWDTNAGQSQYQRSLYTFWKRQNPHPSMLAFDAPTRQECTARRSVTNTPGQALALLNDPIYVEAARVLAERLLSDESLSTTQDRIEYLYQRALQRAPSAAETKHLSKLVDEFESHFKEHPDAADKFLDVGQWKSKDDLSDQQHAAWTAVSRIVLNLHEFITRS